MNVTQFRKCTRFDEDATSSIARAKYILYYVTQVAELRSNMTPQVLSARLYDWGISDVSPEEIMRGFEGDSEVRASRPRAGSYELTPQAVERIARLCRNYPDPAKQPAVISAIKTGLLALVIMMLGVTGFGLHSRSNDVRDLSFPEFRRRSQFDAPTTSTGDRAKFFLYFITEAVRLKSDMTAATIADRLRDLGYTTVSEDEVGRALLNDLQIRQSQLSYDAFQINPLALAEFEEKLALPLPSHESITLKWLFEHITWGSLMSGLGAAGGLLGAVFLLGYRFAKTGAGDHPEDVMP